MKKYILMLAFSAALVPPVWAGCNSADRVNLVGSGQISTLSGPKNPFDVCSLTIDAAGKTYSVEVPHNADLCGQSLSASLPVYEPHPGHYILFFQDDQLHQTSCYPAKLVSANSGQ
ncbi:hypothetical protein [Acidihalobacter yilgarnensis]|uniref:hypothetical protein n=1 Tax=Acidihalobacter yilgarnensis TaxID=2819280 RepID=UPI0012E9A6E5|nr:hypothetical protein [Acidihalobacter yilgarnensis]